MILLELIEKDSVSLIADVLQIIVGKFIVTYRHLSLSGNKVLYGQKSSCFYAKGILLSREKILKQ